MEQPKKPKGVEIAIVADIAQYIHRLVVVSDTQTFNIALPLKPWSHQRHFLPLDALPELIDFLQCAYCQGVMGDRPAENQAVTPPS